jgi:hypothetical protein
MIHDTVELPLDHAMDTDIRVLEQLEEGNLGVITDWLELRVIVDLDAGIAVVEDGVLNQVDHVIFQLRVVQSVCADIFLHLPEHPELLHLEVPCGQSASLTYEYVIDGGDFLRTFDIFNKKPIFSHWF